VAEEFVTGSGASLTYPMQCGDVKKGGYVLIRGFPCRVVATSTSKTGKHGHAKMSITALDIFTGKKYEMIETTSHDVEVPNVTKAEYTLVDIDEDGFMSLMDEQGNMKADLKVPDDEVGEGIKAFWAKKQADDAEVADKELFVTTQSAMNHEAAVAFKLSKEGGKD